MSFNSGHSLPVKRATEKRKLVVFLLGGMTHYEVAQLYKLAQDDRLELDVIPVSDTFVSPLNYLKAFSGQQVEESKQVRPADDEEESLDLELNIRGVSKE